MQNQNEHELLTPEERRRMSEQNRSLAQEQSRQQNNRAAENAARHEEVQREQENAEMQAHVRRRYDEMQERMERLRKSEENRVRARQTHQTEERAEDETFDDAYYYDYEPDYDRLPAEDARDADDDSAWINEAFEVVQPRRTAPVQPENGIGHGDEYADDTDYYAGYADGTDSEPRRMPPMTGFAPISGTAALADEPDEEDEPEDEEETDVLELPEPEVLAEPARHYEEGTKGAMAAAGGTSRRTKVSRGGRFNEKARRMSNPNRITTGSAIFIGLLLLLLLGLVIYGKVQTNEMYMKIASLQSEYDDLVSRNVSMRSEMEARLTVRNIEEYAEKELGLKQLDQSQIEYIAIQTEDEVYITEPQDSWEVVINEYLSAIWDFVRGR